MPNHGPSRLKALSILQNEILSDIRRRRDYHLQSFQMSKVLGDEVEASELNKLATRLEQAISSLKSDL